MSGQTLPLCIVLVVVGKLDPRVGRPLRDSRLEQLPLPPLGLPRRMQFCRRWCVRLGCRLGWRRSGRSLCRRCGARREGFWWGGGHSQMERLFAVEALPFGPASPLTFSIFGPDLRVLLLLPAIRVSPGTLPTSGRAGMWIACVAKTTLLGRLDPAISWIRLCGKGRDKLGRRSSR